MLVVDEVSNGFVLLEEILDFRKCHKTSHKASSRVRMGSGSAGFVRVDCAMISADKTFALWFIAGQSGSAYLHYILYVCMP